MHWGGGRRRESAEDQDTNREALTEMGDSAVRWTDSRIATTLARGGAVGARRIWRNQRRRRTRLPRGGRGGEGKS